MVKGFTDAWRNSGRKESEISIRYQYKIPAKLCVTSRGLYQFPCSVIIAPPNKILNFGGAILPCFAVAPLRGERNGNQIIIDVPA